MGGLLRTFKSEGDIVTTGDVLAAISDPFGEAEAPLSAEIDGIIVGRAVMPVVNDGDALFHIATLRSPENAGTAVDELTLQLEEDPLLDEDDII